MGRSRRESRGAVKSVQVVTSPVRLIISIALIAIVGLCAAVVAAGLFLSAPARAVVGDPPPDLAAEPVAIASSSGATLRGWFLAGRPGGGAVVLMHGVRGNRLAMVRRARLLEAAGFAVLLFDFQAHGESTGARITFGYREGLDAAAAVAFMRQRLPAERIGAVGSSLGAAAALLGPDPLPVEALVLESVYPDIGTAIANRIRSVLGRHLGTVTAPPLAFLFQVLLPPVLGVNPVDLRPIDRIGKATASLLVASGKQDNRTTIAETMALFARAPEPKTLWALDDAGHVDLEAHAPEEYRRHVLAFLADKLQQPR
ncbi:MAG TPA: alpha/beta fold hydrolase [Xanthobacteraceae bacterium]|nr:alpha/beta fold hydrolase [Xanthobacteraceae bacterium]